MMRPHYYKGSNCFEFHFLETQMSILMHVHGHICLCPSKGGMWGGWWKREFNTLATYCKSRFRLLFWPQRWSEAQIQKLRLESLKRGHGPCNPHLESGPLWLLCSSKAKLDMHFHRVTLKICKFHCDIGLQTKGKLVYFYMKNHENNFQKKY